MGKRDKKYGWKKKKRKGYRPESAMFFLISDGEIFTIGRKS